MSEGEFGEQEGKGLRGSLLCTEQFVQNGNLVSEIGAKNNVSMLHTVIIEDESGKIIVKERDSGIAKGEKENGNYFIDQVSASHQSPLDPHQFGFTTICRHLPTYFSDMNTDLPIPETELGQELIDYPKSQSQAELYCFNITEKDTLKEQNNFLAACSPKTSPALGEVHIPEQIEDLNQNLSLECATHRSGKCATVNYTGQQTRRLASTVVSKGNPDGTKGKKCPPETPEEPVPPTRKKSRTFYSAGQLDELERMFQEDHYPNNEKRREIAAAVGVTPQRVMVWFQNRRAKWRKIEKLTVKGNQKCSVTASALSIGPQPSSQCTTLLPVPQLSSSVHDRSTVLMTGTATINYSSMLSGQAAPLASISVTGRTTPYESFQTKAQGTFGTLKEELLPAIPSPPPIRRASLPLSMVFNSNSHIVPLTPSSEYSPSSQENSSSEAFTYNIQTESINSPVHCSFPEQLEPTANLETSYYQPSTQSGAYQFCQYPQHQVSQLHHFPIQLTGNALPSVHLTPATPSKSSTAIFSLPGNSSLLTYGTTEAPRGYLQNHLRGQLLIQPSTGSSGYIPAFQAVPWNEFYLHGTSFANQLCSEMPFFSSGGGCYSAEQAEYSENQSVPPGSCLLYGPKAAVPALFPAKQLTAADPNANSDYQSQVEHTVPLEKHSDADNILKDEQNVADFSEERKN
ncbi:homeobox protein NOBOX isoform X2 [Varanus komodoensis]|uniref:Homeobox domain-containing protein n=1 Tax=Varanus komodoensis TaxID=61221 RepID=A0A8D2KVY0_VARKO|nr:homeobox protein NOBOX isoform X2 [Varanus komodoensis]